MILETFAVGALACNCTLLGDERTGEAIVIDGGDGIEEALAHLERRHLHATLLLHTHAHIDHIGDAGRLRAATGARALLHPADLPLYQTLPLQAQWIGLAHAPPVVRLDGDLHDGEHFTAGAVDVEVLHTPGHTLGSVCFAVREDDRVHLLTGDTLFAGSIGRWDFGGTSMEDIVDSIRVKLLPFEDETPVVPGHGPPTTIGIERRTNPYLSLSS
ncbi:MAG TPA: MBL fold metallo-hydrolase [Candidatus Tyrphobacter sp.]